MATRYIRSWEDLEEAVKLAGDENAEGIDEGDDLIFVVAGFEVSATVTDWTPFAKSASTG